MSYPQHPGQPHYQQGPYPPGHYPPPYGQPGGYGPPPAKPKTGLWVGLAFGLVILIALGITGFVAPGFFLSKDDKPAAGSPTAGSQGSPPPAQFPGVDQAAQGQANKLLQALNSQDSAGATALFCRNIDTLSTTGVQKATTGTDWVLENGSPREAGDIYFSFYGKVNGKNASLIADLTKENSPEWCFSTTTLTG